ncbi:MAG: T9SS type A sorting domain-containing protein [Saprospiraceae bacterium]
MKSPVFVFAFFLATFHLSGQCVSLLNCPAAPQSVCDSSANEPQFWNEVYWTDATYGVHDLAETSTELSLQVANPCGGDVQISYLLFLDLDGNGARETVVSSSSLPGTNTVFYGNAFNPNYLGGEARQFDERPVPNNQRYGFALEKTTTDNITTARVAWSTAPGNYVNPQLPLGTHRIEWRVEKDGEVQTCAYDFIVKDCQAPTVGCLNGLSVNILPSKMIQLWATDFLMSAGDNISPLSQLQYGVRRPGTGTGFPLTPEGQPVSTVVFTCTDLGSQAVELWVRDKAGNAGFCSTSVLVQDNLGNCQSNSGTFQVCAESACSGAGIAEVGFEVSTTNPAVPPFTIFSLSGQNGCLQFNFPATSNPLKITPGSDGNPLNGVSTYDMLLLEQYINGTLLFTENWQWVAADADLNGVIDTGDLIACRGLQLGILDPVTYPGMRFYPKNFVFPVGNPLALPIPNYVLVKTDTLLAPIEFIGVKTCDLNCNAVVSGVEEPAVQERIGQPQPNPTAGGVAIPLFLQKPEMVRLQILDLSGRVVYQSVIPVGAGEQQLEIPAGAFSQTGLYVWRVQAGAEVRVGKLLKQ